LYRHPILGRPMWRRGLNPSAVRNRSALARLRRRHGTSGA
jgi:hypothetical protein